jgi:hypothetical protein
LEYGSKVLNNIDKNDCRINSVVAVSTFGKKPAKAVRIDRSAGSFELVWQKRPQADEGLTSFLASAFIAEPVAEDSLNVLGVNTADVAFYRIEVPPVKGEKFESIVMMQAETLLPLGLEEMAVGWRAGRIEGDRCPVTIAAARTERLKSLVADFGSSNPSDILINCQGTARAFTQFFNVAENKYVIMNIHHSVTELVWVKGGEFECAATIDMGTNDLDPEGSDPAGEALFIHDLRDALEFSGDGDHRIKTYIVSEHQDVYEELISRMTQSGFNVSPAVPQSDKCGANATAAVVCEYIETIGIAMLGMDRDGERFDLFKGLYASPQSRQGQQSLARLLLLCVLSVVMAIVLLAVFKASDKAELAALRATDFSDVIKQQDTLRLVARQRADMVDLLTKISECFPKGVIPENFTFQRNAMVTVSGKVANYEQLHKLQKDLEAKRGISGVEIKSQTMDEKKKQISFRMAFHYMSFTKKR